MKIDFTMTYPCFVPMRSEAEPWTFSGGDDQAVAICTDGDLLSRFMSKNSDDKKWFRTTCEDAESMLTFLHRLEGATSKGKPITHVIIDPTDLALHVRTYPIGDFAQHVKKQADG